MSYRDKLPRGIDRRVNGLYRARVFYDGVQYTLGAFHTVGDAKAALAIARSEMARRTFVPPAERKRAARAVAEVERRRAVTVRQWSETWLQGLADAERSPGTISSYRSVLNVHVLPVIGDELLADVDRERVDGLLAEVRAKRGPVGNVARTVRAMFAAAVDVGAGGLTETPVKVSVPKASRARTLATDEIPTADEIRALTEAMPPELAMSVPLAAWCALRLGELLGLQRRDLEHLDDTKRAVLHVRRQWHTKTSPPGYAPPKRGSERSVSIPGSLTGPLAEHVRQHAGPGREGPVFPSARDRSRPVSQTVFDRAWRTARESAGVTFRFHDLRHHGLSLYARQGATLSELMRRGGHTNVDAALIYQVADAERDRELTARLDDAMRGTDTPGRA